MNKRGVISRVRWAVAFALLLLASSAIPVFAADTPAGPHLAESPTGEPQSSQSTEAEVSPTPLIPGTKDILQAHKKAEREEEKREEELASPPLVAEREASRHAYADASPSESEALLSTLFGEVLSSLNADSARFLSDAKLDRALGDGDALVTSEGKTELMEGTLPVETKDDEGDLKKVDISLEKTPEGYEPENPLVELTIGDRAEDGVKIGSEGLEIVQTGAEDSSARPFGDKNVFFGEVEEGSDMDLMVSPTASGVELFDMLRSIDSPEALHFHLELPDGASLHPDAGGGAEIRTSDGSTLATIPKPSAVDAQGTYVPVTLEVEGDTIVLRVEHRERDLAYPLVVDPEVYEDWAHPSWYDNQRLEGLSAWSWASSGPVLHPEPEDSHWSGHHGLFMATANGSIPSGAWGEYILYRNIGTYISHASLNIFWRANNGCTAPTPYPEPYDFDGMYDAAQGHWNEEHFNDSNKYGNSSLGTWGHELVVGLGTSSAVSIPCWRDVMVGSVETWWSDWDAPYLDYVSGMPTGWIKKDNTPRTIYVAAHDGGLGVQRIRFYGVGSKIWGWNQPSCSGTYEDQCAYSRSGSITFEPSGFPYEGEQSVTVQALDPVEHGYHSQSFTLALDGNAPSVNLSGQFATITKEEGGQPKPQGEGEDKLSLPVYNLTIKAQDGDSESEKRSGVKEIRLYLDGKLLETKSQSCSSGVCPTLEWTYPVKLTGLSEGEHTLEVTAADRAGNEVKPQERKIEFKYIPATGMKEEYVLQHIPLPDGEDHSGEVEPHGPEIAVNVMNGNLVYHERDFKVQAQRAGLELERSYNSQLPAEKDTQWGHGWTVAQAPELKPQTGESPPQKATMTRTSAITGAVSLPPSESQPTFNSKLHAEIAKTSGGGYEVAYENASEVSVFSAGGRIEESRFGDESSASLGASEFPLPPIPAYSTSIAGSGESQLSHPADAAVDSSGNIWMADKGNNRIEKFDSEGKFVSKFGVEGTGDGQFKGPSALALDPKGNIWVVDHGNHRVEEFSPEGKFLFKFGSYGSSKGQLNGPEGIAISAKGSIWVSDTSRVQRFNEEGKAIEVLATKGSGTGQIAEPAALDADSSGRVWIADWGNNRVEVFTETGEFVRQFGASGTADGQFKHPYAIDVDFIGNVWVGDQEGNRVEEFNQSGEFITKFGSAGSGPGQFSFTHPMGIETDGKGALWIADVNNNRLQKWAMPKSSGGPAPYNPPPAVKYTYSGSNLTGMTLKEPAIGSESSVNINVAGGLVGSVEGKEAGTTTLSYESGKLTAVQGMKGKAEYGYDSSKRLTSIKLPNGTTASIEYDSLSRATAVTVDPAGSEGAKTTHFWYGDEPRETRVWGGGNPEIIYNIGEDGSVFKWHYAETPPKIESITGSLWSNRNSTTPIENKDHTLFVVGKSTQEIASIQVLVNGNAVVAEKTCEDNSKPPAHNCDEVKLEWITNAAEHAAGQLNLEVVVTDFLGHSTAERFFVTVPQQPPPNPEAPERPSFSKIKHFREEYGLDRTKGLKEEQLNLLILELLYEWESQDSTQVYSVEKWGVPMRQPEVDEMEYREQYIDQAAQVIPEWAEGHAPSTYGGYYVDNRAGGAIYVGFTENQHAQVEALKQSGGLIAPPGQVLEFAVPPTTPVASLEATEESVAGYLAANEPAFSATTAVEFSPETNRVEVGATNPSLVSEVLVAHFGSSAPINVYSDQPAMAYSFGRYPSSGPVVGGDVLQRPGVRCTAGFGVRAQTSEHRGEPVFSFFTLTAGHCFPKGSSVYRVPGRYSPTEYSVGTVRRDSFDEGGAGPVTDSEAVLIDPSRRSGSVFIGDPRSLYPMLGAKQPRIGMNVCWSGVNGGTECGQLYRRRWVRLDDGRRTIEAAVKGRAAQGDSGGPVWDPNTQKAVGIISGGFGNPCPELKDGERSCSRLTFTPLLPFPQKTNPVGVQASLGVEVIRGE
jgi:YD repeat-containing protein